MQRRHTIKCYITERNCLFSFSYKVMMKCWEGRPISRPTFYELTEKLGSMLEDSVRKGLQ